MAGCPPIRKGTGIIESGIGDIGDVIYIDFYTPIFEVAGIIYKHIQINTA